MDALIIERKSHSFLVRWSELTMFNKRIIATRTIGEDLTPYDEAVDGLLAVRDVLDKQILDVNGVKVVR